jgi:hypothetical protein
MALDRRLERSRTKELKRQSDKVQSLDALRNFLAPALLDSVNYALEDPLPCTRDALTAARAALDELSAALGVEISSRWEPQ